MDSFFLSPAEIREKQQADIQRRFSVLNEAVPANEFTLQLRFRKMSGIPNAMALPGGDIISRLTETGNSTSDDDDTQQSAESSTESVESDANKQEDKNISAYFSTHPDTEQRAQRAMQVSRELGFPL